jgi:hypothetical protein
MRSDVYCDNEQLRNLILDAKPSPGGLYPHELAIVFIQVLDKYSMRIHDLQVYFHIN